MTKLGRLVKDGKIKSLEEIYLYSLPIKEHEIIDMFIGPALKDEVLKIMPVQKQTRAGQRTRFKAFVGKSLIDFPVLPAWFPNKMMKCIEHWSMNTVITFLTPELQNISLQYLSSFFSSIFNIETKSL